MGTRAHTWERYILSELSHRRDVDHSLLFITYAGLNSGELQQIEQMVRQKVSFEKIVFQKASPAILTNCGPGTFGLLYMKKR